MITGTKVAVAAGYLVGRAKKLKVAVAVGLVLAGRKLPKGPIELAEQASVDVEQTGYLRRRR